MPKLFLRRSKIYTVINLRCLTRLLNFVFLVSQDIHHKLMALRASAGLARPAFSRVVLLRVADRFRAAPIALLGTKLCFTAHSRGAPTSRCFVPGSRASTARPPCPCLAT